MPRPARQKHPIRRLRAIIGKTQCGFAKDVGVSPTWLKQIENNVRQLSPRTARLIRFEAGIDDKALLRGKLRRLGGGQKYTLRSYVNWKKHFTAADEQTARKHAEYIACWVNVLFRAAVLQPSRRFKGEEWKEGRLWQVGERVAAALSEAQTTFDLARPVREILRKYGEVDAMPAWYPEGCSAPPKLLRELFPASQSRTKPA
jgi:transcriptional regulator with XRE-family HTH domain